MNNSCTFVLKWVTYLRLSAHAHEITTYCDFVLVRWQTQIVPNKSIIRGCNTQSFWPRSHRCGRSGRFAQQGHGIDGAFVGTVSVSGRLQLPTVSAPICFYLLAICRWPSLGTLEGKRWAGIGMQNNICRQSDDIPAEKRSLCALRLFISFSIFFLTLKLSNFGLKNCHLRVTKRTVMAICLPVCWSRCHARSRTV